MSEESRQHQHISLHKVRVNNLKGFDLEIPYNQLIAFCGLSGSGKSSLAIDTLYAEGQRRYIESFSAYTRQFLEKIEKTDVERIDGIPPSIAVTARPLSQASRSTIGTTTETSDYLRLLFSKIGQIFCQGCGQEVQRDTPESILKTLLTFEKGSRMVIAFSVKPSDLPKNRDDFVAHWKEAGFVRGICMGKSFRFDQDDLSHYDYNMARFFDLAAQQDEEILGEVALTPSSSNPTEYFDPQKVADFTFEEEPDERLPDLEISAKHLNLTDTMTIAESEDIPSLPLDLSNSLDESDQLELPSQQGVADESNDPLLDTNGQTADILLNPLSRILTIYLDPEERHREFIKKQNEMLKPAGPPSLFLVVDRVTIGQIQEGRLLESLETAIAYGGGLLWAFCEGTSQLSKIEHKPEESLQEEPLPLAERQMGKPYSLDDSPWTLMGFSRRFRCEDCELEYPTLEPKLFSFNSPLGACPVCEGFGNRMNLDLNLIVPQPEKSIQEGAIAPWNGQSYRHKLQELLEKAVLADVRTNVPFSKLTEEEKLFIINGHRDLAYDGLNGFFYRLQKQKYKMHIRVFLSRWRSYQTCWLCEGARLRQESLSVRIGGHNIHQLSTMQISDFLRVIDSWSLTPWQRQVGKTSLTQVKNRLHYLEQVGLGYLTLDRLVRTLSDGEQRRVNLTTVLGSNLVDVLYVLDEPSIGLHPQDTEKLLGSILSLRDRGNSVIVVEHEERILKAADRIIEIGPGAGQGGGQITFQGTWNEIIQTPTSVTGSWLSGRLHNPHSFKRRRFTDFVELVGARGHNLKNVTAVFPLGVLCLVTGVSGAGKSTLIQETLYPALCRSMGRETLPALPFDKILNTELIDDVVLVDQSPIGRSPRSNPVTYLKIFDDIRTLFAETPDSKSKNYNAGYFSFNVDGGRCNTCKGEGFIVVDMQFMADMFVRCPQCGGKRYQREILDILYRGKNIAEVLEMTVREAFSFFRGQPKIQQKLKRLIDVGLDYLRLGQPANTLSGGESQRLKLAAYLSSAKKGRCLFLLDEPTTGLHFADVVHLLDGFDALIETGHSLIVVEHNLQMMLAADYIIDLGPGAAEQGGQIIAEGTPEEIASNPNSPTGHYLANYTRPPKE